METRQANDWTLMLMRHQTMRRNCNNAIMVEQKKVRWRLRIVGDRPVCSTNTRVTALDLQGITQLSVFIDPIGSAVRSLDVTPMMDTRPGNQKNGTPRAYRGSPPPPPPAPSPLIFVTVATHTV